VSSPFRIVPEVIDGCSCGGERERVKRFGDHGLQKVDGGDAHGHVWHVVVAAVLENEICDVWNEHRYDVGVLGRGDERGGGACGHGERRDWINRFLLQPQQIGCRLCFDGATASGLITAMYTYLNAFSFQLVGFSLANTLPAAA
jgi:hypothetical protein